MEGVRRKGIEGGGRGARLLLLLSFVCWSTMVVVAKTLQLLLFSAPFPGLVTSMLFHAAVASLAFLW